MHDQAKVMRRAKEIEKIDARHQAEHALRLADRRSVEWNPRVSMPKDRSNDTPEQIEKHKARKVQCKAAQKRRKTRQREAAKEEKKEKKNGT